MRVQQIPLIIDKIGLYKMENKFYIHRNFGVYEMYYGYNNFLPGSDRNGSG